MGQADLAGARNRPAAHQAGLARRVMRRSERPRGNDRLARREQAHARIDAGRLERLFDAQHRQDGRQPPRQHRLAAARRPDHQNVVPSGRRHRQGAFGVFLAAHVRKVHVVAPRLLEHALQVHRARLDGHLARQEPDGLGQGRHGHDLEVGDDGGLSGVGGGQDEALEFLLACRQGHRQGPPDGPHGPVERQFAHHRVVPEAGREHLAGGREGPQRQRQVERRALLLRIGRGQVDRDATVGPDVPGVLQGRGHAVLRFLDGRVGQPHDHHGRQAAADVELDLHRVPVNAVHAHR